MSTEGMLRDLICCAWLVMVGWIFIALGAMAWWTVSVVLELARTGVH